LGQIFLLWVTADMLMSEVIMAIVWQAEDNLREKKVESDLKDLLKTLVAFANSVAPGDTAHIFIGEKDDGSVQGVRNTDNIQKTIKKEADQIYPEIYYRTEVYEREGKQCVRVDISHNGLAPHFGGGCWVRRASTSVPATEEMYQQLIDLRSSKVRELSKWVGKRIVVSWSAADRHVPSPNWWSCPCALAIVTGHFSTFEKWGHQGLQQSEPNEWLHLSWNDKEKILQVYVDPAMKSRPPEGW
jgi:Putative DNA-binding domain